MRNRTTKKNNNWIIILVVSIPLCLASLMLPFVIRAYIVQAYRIPADSMKPALMKGDYILVDKTRKTRNNIKRGDIIVFPFPDDPRRDFVKRAIGFPGEVVEIKDKIVFINQKALEEDYANHSDNVILAADKDPRDNLGPIRVPAHSLFVLGDNRDASYDSRYWGFVDLSTVKGKATIIYWSRDKSSGQTRWERIGQRIE